MLIRERQGFFIGFVAFSATVFAFLLVFSFNISTASGSSRGWEPVFSDGFEVEQPLWSITDATSEYSWAVVSYTVNSTLDNGLWSAGGGTLGGSQSWPTGTYTNTMTTMAVAGPFTLTQPIRDMRLSLDVYNWIGMGESLFVGLSDDGVNFEGITLTTAITEWQTLHWDTDSYISSSAVWVGLRFVSDAQDVAPGPLVDNLLLEFDYGYMVYLPVQGYELTPTPLPTPTPMPLYEDHFDDPESGWATGAALRYNSWCRWGWDCHEGWEEVAYMTYLSHNYQFYIPQTWHGGGGNVDTWFVWPVQIAPLPEAYYPLPDHYCIEARGRFANWLEEDYQPWWGHWGIVFGTDDAVSEIYTYQVNANHDVAILGYSNYIYPGNRQPLDGTPINIELPIGGWAGGDLMYLLPTHDYNKLKVEVQGTQVTIYANDVLLAVQQIDGLVHDKIGLIGGSWEVTPIDIMVDYFTYDPYCSTSQ